MTTDERQQIEEPVLRGEHIALALHFAGDAIGAHEPCSTIDSYERDVLSYAYRDPPSRPLRTRCVDTGSVLAPRLDAVPAAVTLSFPNAIRFTTEGKSVTLVHDPDSDAAAEVAPEVAVDLRVALTATQFDDGIVVYHVALHGGPAEAWDEYALIKLAKLSEGGERVDVAALLCFDGVAVDAWAAEFLGPGLVRRGVTVQVLFGDHAPSSAASPSSRAAEHQALRVALQGITQAIFDFRAVSPEEVADALAEPILDTGSEVVWLKKGVLLAVADEDRTLADEGDRARLGVCPYLVIPHAVLLHNEEVLRRVSVRLAAAHEVATSARERRAALDAVREMLLIRVLGNVFHYPSERALFERGMRERGLVEKIAELERGLARLDARHAEDVEREQSRGQMIVEGLLGVVALFSVVDPLHAVFGAGIAWALVAIGGLSILAILWARWETKYGGPAAPGGSDGS